MKIRLIISDDDYRRILATPKRVRGTICQNSPEEFCFRAYSESQPRSTASAYGST